MRGRVGTDNRNPPFEGIPRGLVARKTTAQQVGFFVPFFADCRAALLDFFGHRIAGDGRMRDFGGFGHWLSLMDGNGLRQHFRREKWGIGGSLEPLCGPDFFSKTLQKMCAAAVRYPAVRLFVISLPPPRRILQRIRASPLRLRPASPLFCGVPRFAFSVRFFGHRGYFQLSLRGTWIPGACG